eukprot:4065634-Pyramimonas_sp.AAC.1
MRYCLCAFSVLCPGGRANAPADLRAAPPAPTSGKRCAEAMMLKADVEWNLERHGERRDVDFLRTGWPSPDAPMNGVPRGRRSRRGGARRPRHSSRGEPAPPPTRNEGVDVEG